MSTCLQCFESMLASVKSRLVLPFWYRLTRVVPDKIAVKRVYVQVFLDNGKVDRLLLLCPRLRSRVL